MPVHELPRQPIYRDRLSLLALPTYTLHKLKRAALIGIAKFSKRFSTNQTLLENPQPDGQTSQLGTTEESTTRYIEQEFEEIAGSSERIGLTP
jgi:hypothetical protein